MERLAFVLSLALIWGILYAVMLQTTPIGQYLARQRTWITVVVGVGVTMLLTLLIVPWDVWWQVMAVIAASSLGVITRSLLREWREWREVMEVMNAAEKISRQQATGEPGDLGAGGYRGHHR